MATIVQKQENRTWAEWWWKIKWTSELWVAVNELKKGRVHYIHRSEESTKNVLEGNEFVAEWAKWVQLARVVSSSWTKCMVTDWHNTFPVLTEKNAPLSEAMQKFIDQIKPDRYIPLRFGLSHAGNKKATRDDEFCQRIEHYYTKTLSQTFEWKEYYQWITVGYDSQKKPLVYSSHAKTIYVVNDTVLWANLFGDDVLLDYLAWKMIPLYKPIRDTGEGGEEIDEIAEVVEEVEEVVVAQKVAEQIAESDWVWRKKITQNNVIDWKNLWASIGSISQWSDEKLQKKKQRLQQEIKQIEWKKKEELYACLQDHPKQSNWTWYRIPKKLIPYLYQRKPLSYWNPWTNVRSKNGVAWVIVENINPQTNRPFKKPVPWMVKVQYFRKDPSSGKERSIACMTKIENLYLAPKQLSTIPSVQPTNHTDMKGQ